MRGHIILATPDAEFEERVRDAFDRNLNGELRRWSGQIDEEHPEPTARELAGHDPDVVAVGPGIVTAEALALAEALENDHPEITVILVAKPSPRLWERAMQAGVRAVLPAEAGPQEIREVLERTLEGSARRRAVLGLADRAPRSHRLISVVSPKGGSGKSMVATNLALSLTQCAPGDVVLVDLDLQFGEAAGALRLTPQYTVAQAARGAGSTDATALKVFLTPHSSGLFVLAAPESPAQGEEVAAEAAAQVLKALHDDFRYVVVDTSAGLSEHTLAAVEGSTDLVFVCTMDVPSVRTLHKEMQALDALGMTKQARHFVLNRADARVGLETGDVEATVGMRVDIAIPSSRAVPLSINRGSPLVESDPRSPVAHQIRQLAGRFAELPAMEPSGSRLWRRDR